jgi:hypothetical protein
MAFGSAEALEAYVEPPDVDAGRAFDSTGRLLSFAAEGRRTVVCDAEAVPSHQDELRIALVTALTEAEGEVVRSASLDELVALAAARFTAAPPTSLATIIRRLVTRRSAYLVARHPRTLAQATPTLPATAVRRPASPRS